MSSVLHPPVIVTPRRRRIGALIGVIALGALLVGASPTGAAPGPVADRDAAAATARGDDPGPVRHIADRGVSRIDTRTTGTIPATAHTEGIAGGYVFVPITPYRTFDSRDYVDGWMLGGDEVVFTVLTNAVGVPMIPSGAVAVTYNLTVTNTLGEGYCALYPGPATWPGNSSINWTGTDQTLANGGTVAIGFFRQAGEVSVYCGPANINGTDYVLDITGYYL